MILKHYAKINNTLLTWNKLLHITNTSTLIVTVMLSKAGDFQCGLTSFHICDKF